MSLPATLVLDDAAPVPPEIAAWIGIDRFGQLLHQRQRLSERLERCGRAAGFGRPWWLRDLPDARARVDDLAKVPADRRFVVCTSDVVGQAPDALEHFLGKLAWSDGDVMALPGDRTDSLIAALGPRQLASLLAAEGAGGRRSWIAANRDRVDVIPAPGLASLRDPDTLVAWLSGSLYARAFNQLAASGRTITKSSADVDKLRREHGWWYLLPPSMQRFAVQPYDLRIEGGRAEYTMERLAVPDAAILWIHGALGDDTGLLDAVFEWLRARPTREDPRAREIAESLYLGKVEERMAALLAMPAGQRLDALLKAGTDTGGLNELLGWYRRLLGRVWARGHGTQLAVTHGDLCLSNILYDPRIRLLKLIDPRGATQPDEIWSDPLYDVCKLSHSILGGYDFVNHGQYDVVVEGDMRLGLRLDRPGSAAIQAAFLERLEADGYDVARVRLYEASLFLSMLPLHAAEEGRKLAGFALIAASILGDVERRLATR